MKKTLFVLLFALFSATLSAQTGIGIYPFSNMASLRWNPRMVIRDSTGAQLLTDYKFHVEARTSFSVTHSRRGNSFSAQPEFGGFFRVAGNPGTPMLLSGAGAVLVIGRGGITNVGGFIPAEIEYAPSIGHTHNLVFDAEADVFVTATWSRATFRIRPLLSVSWLFSETVMKKR